MPLLYLHAAAPQAPAAESRHCQHFLLDADCGVLCRIIGLYAARGIDIAALDYRAEGAEGDGAMRLTVTVHLDHDADDELLRVLVAKAGSLFGVRDAC